VKRSKLTKQELKNIIINAGWEARQAQRKEENKRKSNYAKEWKKRQK
jgi:hypothetical protein